MTLDDETEATTIQKLQNSIEEVSNSSGTSTSDVQSEISTYGGTLFLSKKNDDSAAGVIDFTKGLKIVGKLISELLQNADADAANDNNISSALRVLTEIANRALSKQNDDSAQGIITLIS